MSTTESFTLAYSFNHTEVSFIPATRSSHGHHDARLFAAMMKTSWATRNEWDLGHWSFDAERGLMERLIQNDRRATGAAEAQVLCDEAQDAIHRMMDHAFMVAEVMRAVDEAGR